jgi:hypothetical protein
MPNPIKYSTGSETNALKKGNFYIGTGSEGKGPSDVTGYYNGVTPQTGGYVIYMFKDGAPGNLSYHSAANDSELISFTSGLAGQTYTGVSQCFDYYAGQTDKVMIIQEFPSDYPLNYPNIVMPGLILNLDAGITQSYPGSGTTWTDINGLGPNNNGTLTNGPTFNTDGGGSIVFDGVDDYVDCGNPSTLRPLIFTSISWIYNTDSGGRQQGIFCSYSESPVSGFFYQVWNTPHKIRYVLGANTSGGPGVGYTDVTGSITININTWYQIVVTYDGITMKSYVNGTLDINTIPSTGFEYDVTNNKVIVGGTYTRNSGVVSLFKGNINNSIMYNRVLSATEILQNYNAQKGRFGL